MDITALAATAYTGLTHVRDLFATLTGLKIEATTLNKINEAAKEVGQVQDALFQLRGELFRLQEENNILKKQLAEVESWEKKIANYSLTKTLSGAVVFKFNGNPEHFICPSCANIHNVEFLQVQWDGSGICPGCSHNYPLAEPPPDDPSDGFSSSSVDY